MSDARWQLDLGELDGEHDKVKRKASDKVRCKSMKERTRKKRMKEQKERAKRKKEKKREGDEEAGEQNEMDAN